MSYFRGHKGGTQGSRHTLGGTKVGHKVLVLSEETQGWDTGYFSYFNTSVGDRLHVLFEEIQGWDTGYLS